MKYEYFPTPTAFWMFSGSQSHSTWKCSINWSQQCLPSFVCIHVHVILQAKNISRSCGANGKKDKAFNFKMKSEITWTSEEKNWWAFSEQHSGKEWKFHNECMCSFPSIPWHQAVFSISHAAVKCETCNQAANSSPKFYIQCKLYFMNHWGNGFAPLNQGLH